MTEQNRQSLQKFLAQEAEKYDRLSQSQEEVRLELERRAREAIEKYQQEFEQLTPLAKERVENVIKPWFDSLAQDGTYNQLLEHLLKNNEIRSVSVSDSILYYWPDKAFKGFYEDQRDRKKPFDWVAKYVVENYKDLQTGIEKHQDGVDEVWSAGFHIAKRGGLYISQWPIIGGGYGFAVGRARQLEIQVNPKNISASIPSIHPEVWIGFADQIENGTALEVLQESLIPKPIRTIESGSTEWEAIRRAEDASRKAYLERRSNSGK